MEKEEIFLLAQLLQTMKELSKRLEKDFNNKDPESLIKTKNEMLKIQKRIRELI